MSENRDELEKRFTVRIIFDPVVSSSVGWAKITHKCPLYHSPFKSNFIILGTDVNDAGDFMYSVKQHVEMLCEDENDVLNWLRDHNLVDEVSVCSRRTV